MTGASQDVDLSQIFIDYDTAPLGPVSKSLTAQLHAQVLELTRQNLELSRRIAAQETKITALEQSLRLKDEELDEVIDQKPAHLIEVKGSSWEKVVSPKLELCALLEKENANLRASPNRIADATHEVLRRELDGARKQLEERQQHDAQIQRAFRMAKYELYAASVDLLGYSLEVKGGTRNCVVRPAWHLDDTSRAFEFIYSAEHKRYIDVAWTAVTREHEALYAYWVQERKSLAGFLAVVFLDNFEKLGAPPERPVHR